MNETPERKITNAIIRALFCERVRPCPQTTAHDMAEWDRETGELYRSDNGFYATVNALAYAVWSAAMERITPLERDLAAARKERDLAIGERDEIQERRRAEMNGYLQMDKLTKERDEAVDQLFHARESIAALGRELEGARANIAVTEAERDTALNLHAQVAWDIADLKDELDRAKKCIAAQAEVLQEAKTLLTDQYHFEAAAKIVPVLAEAKAIAEGKQ